MTNEKWTCAITYVATRARAGCCTLRSCWTSLAAAWSGTRWKQASRAILATDALQMALTRRTFKGSGSLLCHSDQGSQYAFGDYQALLAQAGITCGMSRRGDCYDNAVTESFFGTLETELTGHRDYQNRPEARTDIFEYIEAFYNRKRCHSALGYLSPTEYEARHSTTIIDYP